MRGFSGAVLIAFVCLAVPAGAQTGSGVLGGGAGAALPVGDFSDLFEEAPLYGGWLGIGMYDHGDLLVRFQQSFHDQHREGGEELFGDTDLTLTTVTIGPKFYFTPPSFVARPFVSAELGWARIENDDGGQNVVDDDDRFAFDAGGGFELGRPSWSLGFDVRYHRNAGSGTDFAYVVPMGVFTYRMLP